MATKFVSLTAGGDGSGSSWSNARAWANVNDAWIASLTNGDTVIVEGGLSYPSTALQLTKQLTWWGQDRLGNDRLFRIYSNRTWPWPDNGVWTNSGQYTAATVGTSAFLLKPGGSGTLMKFVGFNHLQYGVQAALGSSVQIATIDFEDCKARNTSSPFMHTPAKTDGQVGSSYTRCKAHGYSENGPRHWGNVTAIDCVFDSQNQMQLPSNGPFGIHVQDPLPGFTNTRWTLTATNSVFRGHAPQPPADASPPFGGGYVQGDNIVAEENCDVVITDCVMKGAADRGIDLKGNGTITRCFINGNGFGVGAHSQAALVTVHQSYFGTPSRTQDDNSALSNIQASGNIEVYNSVLHSEVDGSSMPSDPTYYHVSQTAFNAAGTQSDMITPPRFGSIYLKNSQVRHSSAVVVSQIASGNPTPRFAVIAGLTASSSHSFTVKGFDQAGNLGSASSATATSTTAAYSGGDTTAPTAPTGLTAGTITSSTVSLSWTPSTDSNGIQGYIVLIDGLWSEMSSVPSITLHNLCPGTLYSITVKAFDQTSNFSAASSAIGVTTSAGSPSTATIGTPGAPAVSDREPGWIMLTWSAASNAVGYIVYDDTGGGPVAVAKIYASANSNTSYVEAGSIDKLVLAGAYAAGTTYAVNDAVTSGGLSYRSLVGSNVGHTPASSPSFWGRFE